jgi:hypothetical protein
MCIQPISQYDKSLWHQTNNQRLCVFSQYESMADVTKRIEKQVAELSPHLHMQCCSTKLGVDVEESTQERHQP